MERISALSWRESALMVLCLVSTLGLKDVTSQSLECYSCTDHGDGGCLPENAVSVTCSSGYNVCLEAISAIRTSHDDYIVLKKGCSYGDTETLDKTISFYGFSIVIQLNQCNSSLCNSEMDLKDYQLATDGNVTHVPNEEQCYSCIGKDECSPNAPVISCYDTYSHCFDGNVTISIDNDTTLIPVKSCTLRYRCAVQTLTHGSASFEIKGACCSGQLCNRDLSNKTQLGDIPFLIFINENHEEPTTTALPNPWVNPIDMQPTTQGTIPRDAPNSTAASRSSNHPQESQTNNTAYGLVFSPWLIFILSCLS
ncbi:ly6/PLAUR domain-containing protein 3-like [Bufo gargarizans]|uniref:ly6/PLAUR domain-containing protein 3-like n=1 Tax=Bufo gargarizans TaxID=30331 RepID=UPI001CF4CFAD|nr:ly6/PLAUR domain-containing protein 3-like [Bufo gargarizans]